MQLPFCRIVSVIAHRAAGNGVRQTEKLCEVNRDTVMHWSRAVGEGCARLLDRQLRNLHVHRLELDEMHTYVHARQRHLRDDAAAEHGDVWAYLAEDAVSRAIVTYALGKRDRETTQTFIEELRARIVGRPHITTDGYLGYLTAIARSFGEEVDLAQVVKEYEGGRGARGLAVADRYVSSTRTAMLGHPNISASSTSHVERLNCTVRTRLSKFGRRTPRHAKSVPHLKADLSLFVAVYNLVDVHSTLKRTPAHALGITDHLWSLSELVDAALSERVAAPLQIRPPESVAKPSAKSVVEPAAKLGRGARTKDLTPREKVVLDVVTANNKIAIAAIAAQAFPNLSPAQAYSWTRNQLRGLRAMKLVERVGKGLYQSITPEPVARAAAFPTSTARETCAAADVADVTAQDQRTPAAGALVPVAS